MVLLTIELITWVAYFTTGFLLLVLLILVRHTLKKDAAKQQKVDKTMHRFRIGKKVPTDIFRGNNYR